MEGLLLVVTGAATADQVATLRRTVLALVAAAFGGVAALCALVAVLDFSFHGDEWDGVGGYFALMIGAPCLLVAVGAGGCLLLTRRHPVVAQVLAALLGGVMVAAALALLEGTVWATVVVVLGAAVMVASAIPTRRSAS